MTDATGSVNPGAVQRTPARFARRAFGHLRGGPALYFPDAATLTNVHAHSFWRGDLTFVLARDQLYDLVWPELMTFSARATQVGLNLSSRSNRPQARWQPLQETASETDPTGAFRRGQDFGRHISDRSGVEIPKPFCQVAR